MSHDQRWNFRDCLVSIGEVMSSGFYITWKGRWPVDPIPPKKILSRCMAGLRLACSLPQEPSVAPVPKRARPFAMEGNQLRNLDGAILFG